MKSICTLINVENIKARVIYAYVITWLMIAILTYFTFYNFSYPAEHTVKLVWIEITALLISLYILYILKKNIYRATTILSYNIIITVALAIFFAPFSNITIAWIFVVPATSVFLQGFKNSIASNLIFFVYIVLYLLVLNIDAIKTVNIINILSSYIVVLITIYVYQLNRDCILSTNKMLLEELATKNKSLQLLATTDSLTSLYNRSKIYELMDSEIKHTKRYSTPLSVMMIDIDYFKYVNDTYGHQAGDSILKEFSDVLSLNFRESDYISRWGGEEFLIALPNTTLQDAVSLAQKILNLISNTEFSYSFSNTCSIGVSEFKKNDTKETLIERADKALYAAKERGRNRVVPDA